MAESEVIQSMVLSFRLTELQSLMVFAGRSKSGRKLDLQNRALELVRLNSSDIKMKIRKLSNAMYKSMGSSYNMSGTFNNSLSGSEAASSATWEKSPAEDQEGSQEEPASSSSTPSSSLPPRRARSTRSQISYAEPEEEDPVDAEDEYSPDEEEEEEDDEEEPYAPSEAGSEEEEDAAESDTEESSESQKSNQSSIISISKSNTKTRTYGKSSPNKSTLEKTKTVIITGGVHVDNKTTISTPSLKCIPTLPEIQKFNTTNSHLIYPPCPDVRLVPLPFFKVEAILLKPSSLNPYGNARLQDQTFVFHLTPSQASSIAASSYRDSTGKVDYKRQIQMRFCLNETSCMQEDNFPASIWIKINGRSQALPNVVPTNKPGVEPRRPPKPINITSLCKLNATVPNYLNVSWTVEAGRGFCVAINYVDKLSSDDLIKLLKEKGNRHPDYTRAIIKDKLNDRDCEIATTSCKVTLACPLGKMRMSLPCRATTCDHLQCFDARLYIQMNERKPKWICPVCNKPALYNNLMVDGYFSEVLNSPILPRDEHEIVLKNDATWDPLPPKLDSDSPPKPRNKPKVVISTPASNVSANVETVDVDDEDSGDVVESSVNPSIEKKKPSVEIDCITIGDSDDEEDNVQPSISKRIRIDDFQVDSPISVSDAASSSYSPFQKQEASTDKQLKKTKKSEPPALICLSDDGTEDSN